MHVRGGSQNLLFAYAFVYAEAYKISPKIYQNNKIIFRVEKKLCFYCRCPEGIGRHNFKMSVCLFTFSRPLTGRKRECYNVEEGIEVDELTNVI